MSEEFQGTTISSRPDYEFIQAKDLQIVSNNDNMLINRHPNDYPSEKDVLEINPDDYTILKVSKESYYFIIKISSSGLRCELLLLSNALTDLFSRWVMAASAR